MAGLTAGQKRQYDEMGYASAAAVILLIIVAVMTYGQIRLGRDSA